MPAGTFQGSVRPRDAASIGSYRAGPPPVRLSNRPFSAGTLGRGGDTADPIAAPPAARPPVGTEGLRIQCPAARPSAPDRSRPQARSGRLRPCARRAREPAAGHRREGPAAADGYVEGRHLAAGPGSQRLVSSLDAVVEGRAGTEASGGGRPIAPSGASRSPPATPSAHARRPRRSGHGCGRDRDRHAPPRQVRSGPARSADSSATTPAGWDVSRCQVARSVAQDLVRAVPSRQPTTSTVLSSSSL